MEPQSFAWSSCMQILIYDETCGGCGEVMSSSFGAVMATTLVAQSGAEKMAGSVESWVMLWLGIVSPFYSWALAGVQHLLQPLRCSSCAHQKQERVSSLAAVPQVLVPRA